MVPGLIFIFVDTAQFACLTNSAARASAGVISTTMDGGICRARGGGICRALWERFGGGLQSMAPRLMDCSWPPMAPKPKPMLSSRAAILLCVSRLALLFQVLSLQCLNSFTQCRGWRRARLAAALSTAFALTAVFKWLRPMPCGVVRHSSARACWRCPKRLPPSVYAFMALNAGTRAPKLKIGQNPNKPGGAVGLELSICDGFKGC